MTTPVQYTIGEKVTDLSWLQCQKLETIVLKGVTPPSCNSFSEGQYAKLMYIFLKEQRIRICRQNHGRISGI